MSEEEFKKKIEELRNPEKSEAGCLKSLLLFFAGVTVGFLNIFMLAGSIFYIWSWLITPFVEYTPNFLLIAGGIFTFNILKFNVRLKDKDYKAESEDVFIIFFSVLILCSLNLAMAYIFSLFI